MKTITRNITPQAALGYLVLALFVFLSLLPLWMAFKIALTWPTDVFASAGSLGVASITWGNFLRVLGLPSEVVLTSSSGSPINFLLALRNSVIYTGLLVSGQLFFSALAAYAFARLRFPGRDAIFYAFIAATMIPSIVLFIPNFVLIRQLGLLNTFAGMVAPNILMIPFAVFFLRQFFLSIPRDLEEAAIIDGASHLFIFLRIVLPLSMTPLATIATLIGINSWNEYFWPFLVAKEEGSQVLTVALQAFQSQTPQGKPDWPGLMAATTITLIPTILLLVAFGRRVVESVQFSGGK